MISKLRERIKSNLLGSKYIKFLIGGSITFLSSLTLNKLFVENLSIPIGLAYILTLIFQGIVNYLICIYFVFERSSTLDISVFFNFIVYVLIFRTLSWVLYMFCVMRLNIYYLISQILIMILLSALKYFYAKMLFEIKTIENES